MSGKWLDYFTGISKQVSTLSPDIHTKVGAVITTEDHSIISTGYNGLPRKVTHESYRLQRPDKYQWMSHAEINAIFNAARIGSPLLNTCIYVSAPPCIECTKAIIQSGITTVKIRREDWVNWWDEKSLSPYKSKENWDLYQAKMFSESGVKVMVL